MFHVRARCAISTVTKIAMKPLEVVPIAVVDGDTHEAGSRLAQRWHLDGRVLIIDEDPLADESVLAAHDGGDALHQHFPELIDRCGGEVGLEVEELLGSIAFGGGEVFLDGGQEFLVAMVGCDARIGAGETEGTAGDEIVVFSVDSSTWICHGLCVTFEDLVGSECDWRCWERKSCGVRVRWKQYRSPMRMDRRRTTAAACDGVDDRSVWMSMYWRAVGLADKVQSTSPGPLSPSDVQALGQTTRLETRRMEEDGGGILY